MKEFVEKLIEQLKKRRKYNADMFFASNDCFSKTVYEAQMNAYENSIRCVNQLEEEYKQCDLCYAGIPCEYQNKNAILPNALLVDKNGWILCSERLPEEPDIQYQALEYFPEYNVTIDGAEKSTTLLYLGDGEWSDPEGNSYNVIAWQPLSSPYKPEEKPEKPQTNFYSERFNRVN